MGETNASGHVPPGATNRRVQEIVGISCTAEPAEGSELRPLAALSLGALSQLRWNRSREERSITGAREDAQSLAGNRQTWTTQGAPHAPRSLIQEGENDSDPQGDAPVRTRDRVDDDV